LCHTTALLVVGPLDVLGPAVEVSQEQPEPHQVAELVVAHDLLVDEALALDGALAIQRVVVRRDLTGDHVLTHTVGGLHDEPVAATGDRIDGEHHSRLGRVDHALDHHGHVDVVQRPLVEAVEEGTLAEEREPAVDDARHHLLEVLDEQIGLLLAGVRRVDTVLGTGRRAHRH
jgi:hypothetical protein